MKLSDIHVGQELIHGKQRELADGIKGVKVLVVGIGHYTETYAPCGRIVKEVAPGAVGTVVVCAIESKRYRNDIVGHELIWEPRIISPRCLMHPAEYQVKHEAKEAIRLEVQAHNERGEALEDALADRLLTLVRPALGTNVDLRVDVRDYMIDDDVEVRIILPDVRQAGDAELTAALEAYKEWLRTPSPRECRT